MDWIDPSMKLNSRKLKNEWRMRINHDDNKKRNKNEAKYENSYRSLVNVQPHFINSKNKYH